MSSLFRTSAASARALRQSAQGGPSALVRYASSSTSSSSSSSPSSTSQQPQHSPQNQPSSPATDLIVRLGTFDFRLSLPSFSLPTFFDVDGGATSDSLQLALVGGSESRLAQTEAQEDDGADLTRWDGFLHAAPKKKTSHSRKAMRSANKGLKDRVDLVHCQGCGTPKLAHHICLPCYYEIRADQREALKRAQMEEQRRALLLAKAKADAEARGGIPKIEEPEGQAQAQGREEGKREVEAP